MPHDVLINEIEPDMRAVFDADQRGERLDAMATSHNDDPSGTREIVATSNKNNGDTYTLNEVLAVLEKMDVLANKKLSLNLVAHLVERVGYQCAGYAETITVAELMLMASRASDLAERMNEPDPS